MSKWAIADPDVPDNSSEIILGKIGPIDVPIGEIDARGEEIVMTMNISLSAYIEDIDTLLDDLVPGPRQSD
jgi:hypothetical protein